MTMNPRIQNWHGRKVWIIGASHGLGRALGLALSAAGAQLVWSGRSVEALADLAQSHPGSMALPLDALNLSSWHAAAAQLQGFWPQGPEVVVFCQGDYQALRADAEFKSEPALQLLRINLESIYSGLEVVLPMWLGPQAPRPAHLVLVASIAGSLALPQAMAYGAAKAGLQYLAETLYFDLHRQGIGVTVVNPGFVRTRLTQKNAFPMPGLMSPEAAAQAMMRGLAQGAFEIHFPKRLTWALKLIRALPVRWRYQLLRRATGL